MWHHLNRLHDFVYTWRYVGFEELAALLLAISIFVVPASAATRFETRGLYMQSTVPAATTTYVVSLQYMSPEAVGSLDMLFCVDPIPYDPCVTPPGLDVSHATLTAQSGESGFSILSQNTNHIILSRASVPPTAAVPSTYTFTGVVNPTDTSQSFAIRLKSLESTDGSGPQIDFGSIEGQVTQSIEIETQVPPMLIFCVAGTVEDNCAGTNDVYYTNLGELSPDTTLTTQSQMAVGTNASGGFAVTANGEPPSTGTNIIAPLSTPTESTPGTNQFGINLVANTAPSVGINPAGDWSNAIPSTDYSQADRYKFVSGDVVASSPNVSLMEKFTVSYILNSSPDLAPGVYATTITYIASGRF